MAHWQQSNTPQSSSSCIMLPTLSCTSFVVTSLLLSITLPGSVSAYYEALFVFGDSSVDTGNHDKDNPALNQPWRPPYGITWPGQPSGRFSDGKGFTDFYASALNVMTPIPFRVINSALSSGTSVAAHVLQSFGGGGVSFAFGGSGVFPTFGPQYPTISAQIDELKQLIASGVVSSHLISSSTVLLSVGGNDYIVFLQSHSANEISLFIPKVVAQIAASAEELYKVGFRAIAVNNLLPVGCLPTITSLNNYTYCNETDNALLSVVHNTLLASSISTLQIKYSTAKFRILDTYNAFKVALRDTKLPLRPCCEGIGGALCGAVDSNGGHLYTLCGSPTRAFLWDSFHPSETASAAIVNYLSK